MRISKVVVCGLFERFNHTITFNPNERITIIYGPNGFGKTMILRILNILFNLSPRSLSRMPFKEIQIIFDDGSTLAVARDPRKSSPQLSFSVPGHQMETFTPESIMRPKDLPFPRGIIEDVVPDLEQMGPSEWRNIYSDDILDLDDVLTTYGELLPFNGEVAEHSPNFPPWLKEIRASLPVRFIDTERLTDLSAYSRSLRHRRRYAIAAPERTVRRYSDKLAGMGPTHSNHLCYIITVLGSYVPSEACGRDN